MSGISTRKGKVYERQVARFLRTAWPRADVRRTSQADRARNSDVIATESPLLERLWLELNDARDPNPLAKLQQAERDIDLAAPPSSDVNQRLPVVIWHRICERSHQVTTRLWVVDELRARPGCPGERDAAVVTLDLRAFIELIDRSERP
jgi:hypothetical protein